MARINPKIDFAFKKLFGSEENKDILIGFINSIVSGDSLLLYFAGNCVKPTPSSSCKTM